MPTFVININMTNAAFEHEGSEVARILRRIADDIEDKPTLPEDARPLRDINGNLVGATRVVTE